MIDQNQPPYRIADAETGEVLGTLTLDPDAPESVKAIVILANDPKIRILPNPKQNS